jgi:DUF1009 family protein
VRAREVIFAGAVAKREMLRDPARLRPDARALAALSRLEGRGDDAILRAVARELESEGLSVIDSTRHLADRLTPVGPLTPGELDAALAVDLALGMRVARALGAEDVGQSVVVREGVVLAVEAKTSKPHQDLRFDVPAIGPATVEVAAGAALRAIGLEAGRTLVLDRERTLRQASEHGIAVVGLDPDAAVGQAPPGRQEGV